MTVKAHQPELKTNRVFTSTGVLAADQAEQVSCKFAQGYCIRNRRQLGRMQKSLGGRSGVVKSLLSSRQPAILAGCTHFRSPRHHTLSVRAAAASSGSEDPYKVGMLLL